MIDNSYVLSIDQGTTGSTAIIFDAKGKPVATSYKEIRQIYPQPGWVEHDPKEIFQSSLLVAREAIKKTNIKTERIKCLGITNQRETTIVWDKNNGEPVCNAIVWQCRRTSQMCDKLKQRGYEQIIKNKTGLVIDAYFSATKLRWILDNVPDAQKWAKNGDLLFGTVDSWLVWNFTRGRAHITDFSNASRTMLFNIRTGEWDSELLDTFDIPRTMLPQVMSSSQIYGEVESDLLGGFSIPISGIAGDQQSALFGQACYKTGMAKNTYGTGSFILLNTGNEPVISEKGLLSTIAWGLKSDLSYAMEGSIFVTGAAIQWLRDGLSIIANAAESEKLAQSVPDTGGIFFVPAFVGLGAPYWDQYARGTIVGITRGTNRGHLARAALEAIAYQVRDVMETMIDETNLNIPVLRVDGGGTANSLLMQFQADILGIPIQTAEMAEITSLGAAYLAGLAAGIWKDTDEISKQWQASRTYEPCMSTDQRDNLYGGWKRAIARAKEWIQD